MSSQLGQLMGEGSMPLYVGVTQVVAAPSEPITLAQAKTHIGLTQSTTDHDDLINAAITAARKAAENSTGKTIGTQTWDLTLNMFPSSGPIELKAFPLQSVTSVKTYDAENTESTMDSADYFVDTVGSRIALNSGSTWPSSLREINAVVIRYVAGYTATPEPIIQAMMAKIKRYYDNPDELLHDEAGQYKRFAL